MGLVNLIRNLTERNKDSSEDRKSLKRKVSSTDGILNSLSLEKQFSYYDRTGDSENKYRLAEEITWGIMHSVDELSAFYFENSLDKKDFAHVAEKKIDNRYGEIDGVLKEMKFFGLEDKYQNELVKYFDKLKVDSHEMCDFAELINDKELVNKKVYSLVEKWLEKGGQIYRDYLELNSKIVNDKGLTKKVKRECFKKTVESFEKGCHLWGSDVIKGRLDYLTECIGKDFDENDELHMRSLAIEFKCALDRVNKLEILKEKKAVLSERVSEDFANDIVYSYLDASFKGRVKGKRGLVGWTYDEDACAKMTRLGTHGSKEKYFDFVELAPPRESLMKKCAQIVREDYGDRLKKFDFALDYLDRDVVNRVLPSCVEKILDSPDCDKYIARIKDLRLDGYEKIAKIAKILSKD